MQLARFLVFLTGSYTTPLHYDNDNNDCIVSVSVTANLVSGTLVGLVSIGAPGSATQCAPSPSRTQARLLNLAFAISDTGAERPFSVRTT